MNTYPKLNDEAHAALNSLPDYMRDGMVLYIEHGIPPGSFLESVLCNDLQEACGRADSVNRHCLFDYVMWLYNHAPAPCWGSPEKVRAWLKRRTQEVEDAAGALERAYDIGRDGELPGFIR